MNDFTSDDGLLELAELVLEGAGYAVARISGGDFSASIAESDNNVVVVAALVAPVQMLNVEPVAARELTTRLIANDAGAKRWDAYVVLLSTQHPNDDLTEALASLANNLRHVRRVIRVGVEPTRAAVSRALRLLLPLPEPSAERTIADPLEVMRERLLSDGVDGKAIDVALESFRLEQLTFDSPLNSYNLSDEQDLGGLQDDGE